MISRRKERGREEEKVKVALKGATFTLTTSAIWNLKFSL